ncbi:hypothetical protein B0J12DRAFT_119858 [Macrophomina phaseolina]|uniref:T. brucei spp.-specific protein n=1 Tax=Macrophomina phaseolina TaxID=35725 RepID=A0ABQ8GAI9_9PEZI|nr:hypothetical protein B0J12DRAFT_119858 [Macrophomina phaseolina]
MYGCRKGEKLGLAVYKAFVAGVPAHCVCFFFFFFAFMSVICFFCCRVGKTLQRSRNQFPPHPQSMALQHTIIFGLPFLPFPFRSPPVFTSRGSFSALLFVDVAAFTEAALWSSSVLTAFHRRSFTFVLPFSFSAACITRASLLGNEKVNREGEEERLRFAWRG